jgi:aerobic-type carbon monoxide dehydrogenase small subunit (CoxS/CutS family)
MVVVGGILSVARTTRWSAGHAQGDYETIPLFIVNPPLQWGPANPTFPAGSGMEAVMTLFKLLVNGEPRQVEADPSEPLLWVLRDRLGLTGTKFSCGIGECGCCMVHVDGQAVRSCQSSISGVAGKTVTTIEGLSSDGLHPVQRAWLEEAVAQCGYCQPGQIMTAAAFLAQHPDPTDDEIASAMSAALCRCGTYQRIRRAVRRAAEAGDA